MCSGQHWIIGNRKFVRDDGRLATKSTPTSWHDHGQRYITRKTPGRSSIVQMTDPRTYTASCIAFPWGASAKAFTVDVGLDFRDAFHDDLGWIWSNDSTVTFSLTCIWILATTADKTIDHSGHNGATRRCTVAMSIRTTATSGIKSWRSSFFI